MTKLDIEKELKNFFGYASFRPHQKEIVEAALSGRDILAVLPTGAGKSLCFQLPALLSEGVTIICSPLIALMKDQVDQLCRLNLPAACLNQSVDPEQTRQIAKQLHNNQLKLLYIAPERLLLQGFLEFLAKIKVARIVVDEAHCISEWGHDFRPEFRALQKLREIQPDAHWMAVTATATQRVRDDICKTLALESPQIFVASFNRPNLSYRITHKKQAKQFVADFVSERVSQSGIIYCLTRDGCEELSSFLQKQGFRALPYHAGLDPETRSKTQEQFISSRVNIICATVAFGMGIDKADVRYVLHYDLPKSIEAYYQETGRAGRDGLPAECVMLFSIGDAKKVEYFFDQISEDYQRLIAKQQLRSVLNFAQTSTCRRQELLSYFDEKFEESCGNCDNCKTEASESYSAEALTFLACVYRCEKSLASGFGLNHLVNIITAKTSDSIERWKHNQLKSWGAGSHRAANFWFQIGRALIAEGYLKVGDKYSTLTLTELGSQSLEDRDVIRLKITAENIEPSSAIVKTKASRKDPGPYNQKLFEELKSLRRKLADQNKVPAFVIFSDETLRDLARKKPKDSEQMLSVYGVGEAKRERYGGIFLEAIEQFSATQDSQ